MNTKLNFKQSLSAGAMAAGVAAITNVILFYAFHGLGIIVDTIFVQPNQPMTVLPIIFASILPTIIASLVFFLLEKYTKNGFTIFSIISIIFLVLSFSNPFLLIPNVTTSYALALIVMHVVVVGALLFFIRMSLKKSISA